MSQKEKMIEDLLKEIDGYYMQLVYLCDLIAVEEDVENSTKLENKSPNFKLITESGLTDAYMMVLMRLYDKTESTKTKSIPNLVEKCLKSIHLFPNQADAEEKLNEFRQRIESDIYIAHAIEVLRLRRDSILAHNDKKYFGEKIVEEHSYFKKYHIWFLRNFAKEVLDYLYSQFSDEQTRSTKYNKDLENLFL